MLDGKDFREKFKSSRGLCLPHFLSAIQIVNREKLGNPAAVARTLVKTEMKRLKLVERYLSEFVRKSSWDFRNKPAGPEVNANAMVLDLLVGIEGLYLAYNRDLWGK
jgi:predicted membrane-bound dolichyl-phosphate-mannose-protein mannosyltransferase